MKENEKTVFERYNISINEDEIIIGSKFKSFEDEFIISLNIYTNKWLLQVNKKLDYWEYILIEEYEPHQEFDTFYYIKDSFPEIAHVLDKIIQNEYDYELRHEANRWWSFLPTWTFLEISFLNPVFRKYFVKYIQNTISGIDTNTCFSDGEKKTLSKWMDK